MHRDFHRISVSLIRSSGDGYPSCRSREISLWRKREREKSSGNAAAFVECIVVVANYETGKCGCASAFLPARENAERGCAQEKEDLFDIRGQGYLSFVYIRLI